MKNLKFPFLKCCEWLYQSALSAGILFVLYGFLQNELKKITFFPENDGLPGLFTAVIFAVQLLIIWSGEKGCLPHAGLGLLAVNAAAGFFLARQPENQEIFWCYIAIEAACIAASVIVYAIRNSLAMKGILVSAQAVSLAVLAILKKPLPAWCVGIMLAAFLIFLVGLRAKEKKEALGLLPFFAAAALLLCLIPKNEKPMDWSWVKEACTAVQEKAEMLSVDIEYMLRGESGVSLTGYGGDAALGGSVKDSERPQLLITGSGTKNPLYLTGKVYESYTGNGWEALPQPSEIPEKDNILGALEHSVYSGQKGLTSSCLINVEYRLIKTTDFFHELNTTNLYGDMPLFSDNSPWTMKNPQKKDFAYQIRFLEINENSDEIKALYRQQAWKNGAVPDSKLSAEEAEIYRTCTVLPENIPQRIYALADEISADYDNNYDKMQAFADYLSDFTYTKSPPKCPDGQEFTDYFLFDSRNGYCTYFATAMAVLGRCEGIPTRYVRGFVTSETCSRREVTITGAQAHAWTEFYLDNIGWVRIDATPGYGEASPDRWDTNFSAGDGQTGNPYNPVIVKPEKPDEKPEKPAKTAEWYVLLLVKILAAVLAVCVLTVAAIWLRNAVRRKKYSHMTAEEKVRLQLKRLLRLGKLHGLPIADGETLQGYQERAHDVLDTAEYTFERTCGLYESIRFGGKTASTEALRELEAYTAEAERGYLAGCGLVRKIIYWVG